MGREVAERVSGMLSSGSIAELEQMRHETPIDVLDMTAIEGIGPRRACELLSTHDPITIETTEVARHARSQGRDQRVDDLEHGGSSPCSGVQQNAAPVRHHLLVEVPELGILSNAGWCVGATWAR